MNKSINVRERSVADRALIYYMLKMSSSISGRAKIYIRSPLWRANESILIQNSTKNLPFGIDVKM